jgi:hypothetical protein
MRIGGRFPRHDDQIDWPDFFRATKPLHFRQREVAMDAFAAETVLLDVVEIRTQQELHVFARRRQPAAIIQANRSRSDDCHASESPAHAHSLKPDPK